MAKRKNDNIEPDLIPDGGADGYDIRREAASASDADFERALRPGRFESFSGQEKIVENLKVFVAAARMRGEALDHLLLHGPPGLGKTTRSAPIFSSTLRCTWLCALQMTFLTPSSFRFRVMSAELPTSSPTATIAQS